MSSSQEFSRWTRQSNKERWTNAIPKKVPKHILHSKWLARPLWESLEACCSDAENVYHRLFIFLGTIKVVAWELASPSNPMYVLLPEPHWKQKGAIHIQNPNYNPPWLWQQKSKQLLGSINLQSCKAALCNHLQLPKLESSEQMQIGLLG
jgi:hypothetical protein